MQLISLSDFLDFLSPLRTADFKSEKVDAFLKTSEFVEDSFLPFVHFRDDTYGRNLVYRNQFFELAVLTWLPGHRTPIHDHSNQRCWMMIDSGELTFRNYEAPGTGKIRLKPVGHAETRKRGAQLYIDDDLGVHSISNASTKPAVSVHLYAGPITACRIYNEISRSFELKKLSYLTEGVWSPKGQFIESRICEPTLI